MREGEVAFGIYQGATLHVVVIKKNMFPTSPGAAIAAFIADLSEEGRQDMSEKVGQIYWLEWDPCTHYADPEFQEFIEHEIDPFDRVICGRHLLSNTIRWDDTPLNGARLLTGIQSDPMDELKSRADSRDSAFQRFLQYGTYKIVREDMMTESPNDPS